MVVKIGIERALDSEFGVLQMLQGVAGVPTLAHPAYVNGSIITTTALEQLTWSTISVQHLHGTFHTLVQTLQVRNNLYHCFGHCRCKTF